MDLVGIGMTGDEDGAGGSLGFLERIEVRK